MASIEVARTLSKYKVDPSLPMGGRIAHLLDWAAKEMPYKYLPLQLIVKYVMGYAHTPRAGNDEVIRIRNLISSSVRRTLERDYNREIVRQLGMGVRATVDSADVLKVKLPYRTQRLNNARAQLVATADRIDLDKVPKTKENEQWREWYERQVTPVLKALKAANVEVKLLPPGES